MTNQINPWPFRSAAQMWLRDSEYCNFFKTNHKEKSRRATRLTREVYWERRERAEKGAETGSWDKSGRRERERERRWARPAFKRACTKCAQEGLLLTAAEDSDPKGRAVEMSVY